MPYRSLSSFYFFYFASLGALIPYWALYLESLDFTPRQIGELMAILMATKIVAPNIWGWIADHTGRGMGVVRLGSLLAMLSFTILFFGQSYLWIAMVMLLFSFFWNAVLPQFEAVTLDHLRILIRPQVLVLLVACFLMQASHGPYYTFYTIYMEQHGYSRSLIGQLWGLGVLAEVGIFLMMHRLVSRISLPILLFYSLLLAAVRWICIALWAEYLYVMLFAQTLHAASFGVFHASAIALVHRFFIAGHQGKGQALYSSISFGAGGAVGSLYGGYMWEQFGPPSAFLVAALLALAGMMLTWLFLESRSVPWTG